MVGADAMQVSAEAKRVGESLYPNILGVAEGIISKRKYHTDL